MRVANISVSRGCLLVYIRVTNISVREGCLIIQDPYSIAPRQAFQLATLYIYWLNFTRNPFMWIIA